MNTPKTKGSPFIGFAACLIIGIIFCFTPYWQGAVLAGMVAGLCHPKRRVGFLLGLTGVAAAWGFYMTINQNSLLLDQVSEIIIGDKEMGFVLLLIAGLCGGILGALGGLVGSSLRSLGTAPS